MGLTRVAVGVSPPGDVTTALAMASAVLNATAMGPVVAPYLPPGVSPFSRPAPRVPPAVTDVHFLHITEGGPRWDLLCDVSPRSALLRAPFRTPARQPVDDLSSDEDLEPWRTAPPDPVWRKVCNMLLNGPCRCGTTLAGIATAGGWSRWPASAALNGLPPRGGLDRPAAPRDSRCLGGTRPRPRSATRSAAPAAGKARSARP